MKQVIELNGKKIILIGTAHISQDSIREVSEVIQEENPDTVCVELCQTRFDSIRDKDRWKNMDIVKVIKDGKAPLLMANLVMTAFQKKMGDQLGVQPGAEMIQAVADAEEIDAEIVLADREVSVTLKRVWRMLSLWEKAKIMTQLLAGLFTSPEISEEDIEQMKEGDLLSSLLEEMSHSFPKVKEVLIDERDQFLASKISDAPGEVIVAVVGAGHVPGIQTHLGKEIDLEKIQEIPPPGKMGKIIKWGIPIGILAVIAYGFFGIDTAVSIEMIKRWVLANGILSALGAALAGGHILTVLSAFVAAPITSLNPTIAAGWVSGLTEAWVRKPKVSDFENLATDIVTVKGFWKNELTRILLVVVLSNLGSTLGTIIGIPLITSLLS